MARNLLVRCSYCGSAYHGFQIQKNGDTVAARLMDAIFRVTGEASPTIGCSRTDAGVHAREYFFNFHTDAKISAERLPAALSAHLPYDIAVTECREVPEDFHARYRAVGKEYCYLIHNSPVRDPFCERLKYHYRYPLDEKLMNRAAEGFLGTHDFSAFCSAGSSVKDTVRTITFTEVRREGDLVIFTVRGTGFLYNMVRIMAGTLLGVAEGKLGAQEIPEIIQSRERSRAGATAPAHGLYLNRVFYTRQEFEALPGR